MALIGIGTDLVEIGRIEASYQKFGTRFVKRVLSKEEQQSKAFLSKPVSFLAKRFAAKEALMKALGTGLAQGLRFDDFSVLNDEAGKPYVVANGKARQQMDRLGIAQLHISISDERLFALAFAVAES